MSAGKRYNPVRGCLALPSDCSNLSEFDWSPLEEEKARARIMARIAVAEKDNRKTEVTQ